MTDPATGGERTFLVPDECADQRLDRFLTEACPDLTRSRIVGDMAEPDAVTVDGRPRPKNFRLTPGQTVVYRAAPRAALNAEPQDIPLDVVHEDDEILVVNKPAGLVVHPAVGHPDGTLVNAVLHRYGRWAEEGPPGGDPLRPGIVHRLDKDTTGLIVVALTGRAHARLAAQLQDRSLGRVYRAVTWGRWPAETVTLEGAIGRHPRQRRLMAVTERGRDAVTRLTVEEDYGFMQVCRVELETGRTHQIRVHCAHHGHPVLGDPLYGDDRRARGVHGQDRRLADRVVAAAGRQMLHAESLHLDHPADGRRLEFRAPLPPDMASVLALLRDNTPAA